MHSKYPDINHQCNQTTQLFIPTELKIAKQCFVGLFYFGFIFGKYMVLLMIFVLHMTKFEFVGAEWSTSKNIVISNGVYKSR